MGSPSDSDIFLAFGEIDYIAQLAAREIEDILPRGLTRAQFGVLNRLFRLERDETISDLANAFQVAQPTMSSTVKRLAGKGLVSLIQDADDRRIRWVRITSNGTHARDNAVAAIGQLIQQLEADAPAIDWRILMKELMQIRIFLDERRA